MGRRLFLVIGTGLLGALIACSGDQEQAIRHLVMAELIQSEHVDENHIRIESVQFVSNDEAVVEAKVMDAIGRAGVWRMVRCKLKRESRHWAIQGVETIGRDEKAHA